MIQGRGDVGVDGNVRELPDPHRVADDRRAERSSRRASRDAVDATSFGAKNVSESFGRQIANNALLAIIVCLLLIVVYISVRFQWKYSVGVLVALAHDVIITIGIYALTGREVTTATVAAVLTVLGYSIYDTIIIFDRIRENVPLMRRASFRVIGNVSMWEVLPRSLATTFITLLPVASLLRLRRRHAEGLRLRAARRHRLGRVLVDLPRRAARRRSQGARARVRAPARRPGALARGRSVGRSLETPAEIAADAEPAVAASVAPAAARRAGRRRRTGRSRAAAAAKRERRRQRRGGRRMADRASGRGRSPTLSTDRDRP